MSQVQRHTPFSREISDGLWQAQPFHAKSIETCFLLLKTDAIGLSRQEAQRRLGEFGEHIPGADPFKSKRQLYLNQFKSWITLLLLAAAGLSFGIHEPMSGLALFIALILNFNLRVFTHWKTQQGLTRLTAFSTTDCYVRRGNFVERIPAIQLVPGDVLICKQGQSIPADARLVVSEDLKVDESLLTGESVLVQKEANSLHIPDEDITLQKNMVFAGTQVKTGQGEAIVTAVGVQTVMGKIAQLASKTQRRHTPFTRDLNRLGIGLFTLVLLLSIGIIVLEIHRGAPWPMMIQLGIVLILAAVPEMLPVIATFILSIGLDRLSRKNIVIKNLHAMEVMGRVEVICTDKTGTLTENAFSLHQIFVPERGMLPYNPRWRDAHEIPCVSVEAFLRIARLNNNIVLDGIRSFIIGDPIETSGMTSQDRGRLNTLLQERVSSMVGEMPVESE